MHRCMHLRVNSGGANKTLMELQDLEKPLSDYGITSATRILVLKHADNAAKRAMDAASARDIRMKRLRQFLLCFGSRSFNCQTIDHHDMSVVRAVGSVLTGPRWTPCQNVPAARRSMR
jgi:hypothetical protein